MDVGSIVKCAECDKDSEIEFIGVYKRNTGYFLSCQHRNAYCKKCSQLAWDVSDTHKEVHIMCNNCSGNYPDFDKQNFKPIHDHVGGKREPQIVEVKITDSCFFQCLPTVILKIDELIAVAVHEQEVLSFFD